MQAEQNTFPIDTTQNHKKQQMAQKIAAGKTQKFLRKNNQEIQKSNESEIYVSFVVYKF